MARGGEGQIDKEKEKCWVVLSLRGEIEKNRVGRYRGRDRYIWSDTFRKHTQTRKHLLKRGHGNTTGKNKTHIHTHTNTNTRPLKRTF